MHKSTSARLHASASGPSEGRGAATRDASAGGALWMPRVQNILSRHTLTGFNSKKLN
jgi:hypothetical protein